jgi:uncharacterized membrane protein YdjX (TVP38/TMEM64 family)
MERTVNGSLARRPCGPAAEGRPWAKWALLALLALAAAAGYLLVRSGYVSVESLHAHRLALRHGALAHPYLGAAAFALGVFGATALSLPLSIPLALLGGYLFGLAEGALLTLPATSLGAVVSFGLMRQGLGGVRQRVLRRPPLRRMAEALRRDAFGYLVFLRLAPIFPVFVVHALPALLKVPLRTYFWATLLGMTPGTLLLVYCGRQLGHIHDAGDLLSPGNVGVMAALAAMGLLPLIHRRAGR